VAENLKLSKLGGWESLIPLLYVRRVADPFVNPVMIVRAMLIPTVKNLRLENGIEGLYCLIFKKSGDGIYCCKWTIEYQYKEIEPMLISSDSPIEAYILHMKRYFDVKGSLKYPRPNNHRDWDIIRGIHKESRRTLHNDDINDYGEFIRAYKTLEEAKAGALARCGWQGLNRETVVRKR